MTRLPTAFFVCLALVAVLWSPVTPATANPAAPLAALIAVTTPLDSLAADDLCSLREAITAANTDAAVDACLAGVGHDTILLPAGTYTLTLAGRQEDENATGDLDLLADLTIQGVGNETIIDAAGLDRVLHLPNPEAVVVLDHLILQHGRLDAATPSEDDFGAGIWNTAHLTLSHVQVRDNDAWGVPEPRGVGIYTSGWLEMRDSQQRASAADRAFGNGVFNTGALIATRCRIGENWAYEGIGGALVNEGDATFTDCTIGGSTFDPLELQGYGGAFVNGGTLICTRCEVGHSLAEQASLGHNGGQATFIDSHLDAGGSHWGNGTSLISDGVLRLIRSTYTGERQRGIDARGEVWIQSSLISGHSADDFMSDDLAGGGAILMNGKLTVLDSLFLANYATGVGGAIRGSGDWLIANTTFRGNRVTLTLENDVPQVGNASGGALYFDDGNLQLLNVSLFENSAETGGGALLIGNGRVRIDGSTIVRNIAPQGAGLMQIGAAVRVRHTVLAENPGGECWSIAGTLVSDGFNLLGFGVCPWTPAPGDRLHFDPKLTAPLAVSAHLHVLGPLPGSPTIDRGHPTDCLPLDARQVTRPQGAACDIGAVELTAAPIPLTVPLDILPGLSHNRLDPAALTTFPAAILSTPDFFAPARVNPASLRLGATGGEASLAWKRAGVLPDCWFKDANRDLRLDLVCRFVLAQTGLSGDSALAFLTGAAWDGRPLHGADAVIVLTAEAAAPPADALWLGESLLWLPAVTR